MTSQILQIGRRQLAEQGAAALSLRAVTRELGMVSSAVYRYVANRDDLLTLLVVDAYTELADAVDTALQAGSSDAGLTTRVLTLAHAVRRWALAEPARYALLYGSPVPGYAAPGEVTVEPGTRVLRRFGDIIERAAASGQLVTGAGPVPVPRSLRADLTTIRQELGGAHLDASLMARGIFVWTAIVGAVSSEVFGQLGDDTFADQEALFDHQVRLALSVLSAGR